MSRSGYNDDCDGWPLICWRGAVNSAIKGKRGQAFLRELAEALDAMPEKRLISGDLQHDGEFCTLGVIGAARGIDINAIDPDDREAVAAAFNIAPALAAEIEYENDESISEWDWVNVEVFGPVRPAERRLRSVRVPTEHVAERRWAYMRAWVASQIADMESKS